MGGLLFVTSFKELMERYDLREYTRALEEGDVEGIINLVRTARGRRTPLLVEEAVSTVDLKLLRSSEYVEDDCFGIRQSGQSKMLARGIKTQHFLFSRQIE